MVRCGSCLQVFNAAKQLLDQRAGKEAIKPVAPAIVEPPVQRAISQKQWTASELDLDSLDLDEELARLEQREIQPITEFGRHREDGLSARRDSVENDDEPWSDSLFSESAADRAQSAETEQPKTEPEPGKHSRTEPSFSLEPVDPDDEPQVPHPVSYTHLTLPTTPYV